MPDPLLAFSVEDIYLAAPVVKKTVCHFTHLFFSKTKPFAMYYFLKFSSHNFQLRKVPTEVYYNLLISALPKGVLSQQVKF